VEHKGIQEWVTTFVKNTGLSGLVCFDFLVDKDDNVYCIECNPRLHSAIVSFESQSKVSNYIKKYSNQFFCTPFDIIQNFERKKIYPLSWL
jgi:predicted ATP-grasp superfamily ATP-dependent carboligase